MGLLNILRWPARPDFLAGPVGAAISSPWSTGQLNSIVWSDIFGDLENLPLTRAETMSIPAVSKGRNLLVATISGLPLRALDANGLLVKQPTWMYRTDGQVSPWHRMCWTIDDLIFFGCSIWLVERDSEGFVRDADRCPPERWKVTNGQILVDDKPVDASQVIYIPGPHEGLLSLASRTLRGARDQEAAWVGRARNPVPLIELHMTDDSNLTQDEVKDFVEAWGKARRAVDGAIGFTPQGLEIRTHGDLQADLMTEGRNSVRIDVGSFLGIPAALMDSSLAQASLTYVTTAGNRSQFIDYTLPMWTEPIQQRLSMDDVVPRGQRVRFDLTDLTGPAPAATGAPVED